MAELPAARNPKCGNKHARMQGAGRAPQKRNYWRPVCCVDTLVGVLCWWSHQCYIPLWSVQSHICHWKKQLCTVSGKQVGSAILQHCVRSRSRNRSGRVSSDDRSGNRIGFEPQHPLHPMIQLILLLWDGNRTDIAILIYIGTCWEEPACMIPHATQTTAQATAWRLWVGSQLDLRVISPSQPKSGPHITIQHPLTNFTSMSVV